MIENVKIIPDICKHGDFNCPGTDNCFAENGWETHLVTGDSSELRVRSFRKAVENSADYEYIIILEDATDFSPHIYCEGTIPFLELYSKYAALARDSSLNSIMFDLTTSDFPDSYGIVEQVAARARYGADETLDVMIERKRRRAKERRERIEELRKSQGNGA